MSLAFNLPFTASGRSSKLRSRTRPGFRFVWAASPYRALALRASCNERIAASTGWVRRAAGSPRLRTILETMIDMPIIKRSFYIYTPYELEQSLNHHRDLTLAAQAEDGELARQVMQLHLRMSFHRFMRHRSEYRQDATKGGVA